MLAVVGLLAATGTVATEAGEDDATLDVSTVELVDAESGEVVAVLEDGEWDGSLPAIEEPPLEQSGSAALTLEADAEDEDGNEIDLGEYDLGAEPADGTDDELVSVDERGDAVHLDGSGEGETDLVFVLRDGGAVAYETPSITADVDVPPGVRFLVETTINHTHACFHGDYDDRVPLDAGDAPGSGPIVDDDHVLWNVTHDGNTGYVSFDPEPIGYDDVDFVFYSAEGSIEPLNADVLERGDVDECPTIEEYAQVETPEDGTIEFALSGEDRDDGDEPAIEVSNLDIAEQGADAAIDTDEDAPVTVDIENVDDEGGESTVELDVLGGEPASETVDLEPGETESVTFEGPIGDLDAGSYVVYASTPDDGESGSLLVDPPSIAGTVTDFEGEPVESATVNLFLDGNGTDGDADRTVEPEPDGTYAIDDVDARFGASTLEVTDVDGHAAAERTVETEFGADIDADVRLGLAGAETNAGNDFAGIVSDDEELPVTATGLTGPDESELADDEVTIQLIRGDDVLVERSGVDIEDGAVLETTLELDLIDPETEPGPATISINELEIDREGEIELVHEVRSLEDGFTTTSLPQPAVLYTDGVDSIEQWDTENESYVSLGANYDDGDLIDGADALHRGLSVDADGDARLGYEFETDGAPTPGEVHLENGWHLAGSNFALGEGDGTQDVDDDLGTIDAAGDGIAIYDDRQRVGPAPSLTIGGFDSYWVYVDDPDRADRPVLTPNYDATARADALAESE
ncbi:hypothetical protein JCM18750_27540 [Halostagnicola bangensis]